VYFNFVLVLNSLFFYTR